MRDIAKKLGISHSTVSRALHDNPLVSPLLRKQIQEVAERMDYRPNSMAAALAHQRQSSDQHSGHEELAWLNYRSDPATLRRYREFNLYWEGAWIFADRHGYRLEEFICNARLPAARLEKILLARNIRGILIPPHGNVEMPPGWQEIQWGRFNVVRFGYGMQFPPAHIVGANHLASGIMAFENMRKLGYERPAYVCGKRTTSLSRAGFLMKQSDAAPGQPNLVLMLSEQDQSRARSALKAWLRKHKPDAIFTDVAAMRSILKTIGYRVPEDIGLASMSILDGNADAGINQNSEQIGAVAVETLTSLINHTHYGVAPAFRETLVEGKWVNGSTLPPRGESSKNTAKAALRP